jgi:hypothetical protein
MQDTKIRSAEQNLLQQLLGVCITNQGKQLVLVLQSQGYYQRR